MEAAEQHSLLLFLAVQITAHTMLGFIVHTTLGSSVYITPGLSVHTTLGWSVNTTLGLSVHAMLGLSVHTTLGLSVHTRLGLSVHTTLGSSVHTTPGLSVHTTLGFSVHTTMYGSDCIQPSRLLLKLQFIGQQSVFLLTALLTVLQIDCLTVIIDVHALQNAAIPAAFIATHMRGIEACWG
jgi:hypothetical protein